MIESINGTMSIAFNLLLMAAVVAGFLLFFFKWGPSFYRKKFINVDKFPENSLFHGQSCVSAAINQKKGLIAVRRFLKKKVIKAMDIERVEVVRDNASSVFDINYTLKIYSNSRYPSIDRIHYVWEDKANHWSVMIAEMMRNNSKKPTQFKEELKHYFIGQGVRKEKGKHIKHRDLLFQTALDFHLDHYENVQRGFNVAVAELLTGYTKYQQSSLEREFGKFVESRKKYIKERVIIKKNSYKSRG